MTMSMISSPSSFGGDWLGRIGYTTGATRFSLALSLDSGTSGDVDAISKGPEGVRFIQPFY